MQSKKFKNSATIGPKAEEVNLRKVGALGEEASCNYLISKGFVVIERNFRVPVGEIDIIAKKGGEYYFVEVKMRSSSMFGSPFEAIDFRKRKKIIAAAKWFMAKNRIADDVCHLSAMGVDASMEPYKITFLPDAFDTNI